MNEQYSVLRPLFLLSNTYRHLS